MLFIETVSIRNLITILPIILFFSNYCRTLSYRLSLNRPSLIKAKFRLDCNIQCDIVLKNEPTCYNMSKKKEVPLITGLPIQAALKTVA
ncbi:hypothetical protein FEM49_03389 (plasmid) [Lactiplantibacillus plantarum]|nr:hypothetical protein FEM49_03389 [Lactiplantibacillus plantarum]